MKQISFLAAFLSSVVFFTANAQNVGINNTDPKATLDVNGGLRLRPLVTNVTGATVVLEGNRAHHVLEGDPTSDFTITVSGSTQPGQQLIITNKTIFAASLLTQPITGGSTAEFIYSGDKWRKIGSSEEAAAGWRLTGNAGINSATQFIGTTTDANLVFKRNNKQSGLLNEASKNTSWGVLALNPASEGDYNTAIGWNSLAYNTIGRQNTALGAFALFVNTTGTYNTAIGVNALYSNKTGGDNTAIGYGALSYNVGGGGNTAVGENALLSNTEGRSNSSLGTYSLYANTTGSNNTAIGVATLERNITGQDNTAVGRGAMAYAKGDGNTAVGTFSLSLNETSSNTALGMSALRNNISGTGNIAIGKQAGYNELGSNKLYISNAITNKDNTLIYGDFDGDSLNLNAKVNIRDFTRLGTQAGGAPAIKMKKITIPAGPAVDGLANYPFGSGITDSKGVGRAGIDEVRQRWHLKNTTLLPRCGWL